MADDDKADGEEQKPSLIKKLMLPLILSVVVAGGVVGGLVFMGVIQLGEKPDAKEASEGAGEAMEESAPMEATAGGPAFFFTFYPDMLVTLTQGSRSRYLKLSIQVMSRDEAVVKGVEQYQPIIRNNLIKLFQNVEFDVVAGPNGIDELQALASEEITSTLKKYHGKHAIEGVYFTSYVVQ